MEAAVTAATTAIAGVGTDIGTIGGAIIAVAVIVMGIRWVKAQFF